LLSFKLYNSIEQPNYQHTGSRADRHTALAARLEAPSSGMALASQSTSRGQQQQGLHTYFLASTSQWPDHPRRASQQQRQAPAAIDTAYIIHQLAIRIRAMALHALDWQPSPMAGVERRLLDRNGAEIAQATVAANTAPIQLAAGCAIGLRPATSR